MGHPKSKFPTRILLYLSNIKIDEKKVTKTGVLFWVRHIREMWALKSDIISAIDVAFKENGIIIPFQQHDLHIRSGMPDFIKGSEDQNSKQ